MQRKTVRKPTAAKGLRRKRIPGVKSRKLAVSFPAALAAVVERAAKAETSGNISAWLVEAAEERLRTKALDDVIRYMEEKNGPPSAAALAEVDRLWPAD